MIRADRSCRAVGLASGLSTSAGFGLTSPTHAGRLGDKGSASSTMCAAPPYLEPAMVVQARRRLRANKALELTAYRVVERRQSSCFSCYSRLCCPYWRQLSWTVRPLLQAIQILQVWHDQGLHFSITKVILKS